MCLAIRTLHSLIHGLNDIFPKFWRSEREADSVKQSNAKGKV